MVGQAGGVAGVVSNGVKGANVDPNDPSLNSITCCGCDCTWSCLPNIAPTVHLVLLPSWKNPSNRVRSQTGANDDLSRSGFHFIERIKATSKGCREGHFRFRSTQEIGSSSCSRGSREGTRFQPCRIGGRLGSEKAFPSTSEISPSAESRPNVGRPRAQTKLVLGRSVLGQVA
jgi:hypothetical protein